MLQNPFVHFDPNVLAEQRVETQEEWEWKEGQLQEQALVEQEEARERQAEVAQERDQELREDLNHIR